ncbi:MAG TPA: ABC transporter permease [Mycobacteriales bacterium]|nr:ABC transporter permease [Mycobacteriales bacterium]
MTASLPTTAAPSRRPLASELALVGRQATAELKMLWRNPARAGFTFAFPLMFLLIFSLLGGSSPTQTLDGNVGQSTYYLPGIVGYSVLTACLTNLAISLTNRRETGILKRKRGTPLPTWALLAGILISQVAIALVLTVVTSTISILAFDVPFPRHVPELVGVVLLGAACFSALGVAMTVVIPNQDSAPAIVNIVVFPLLFLSGIFFPINNSTLHSISNVLPIARLQQALFDSYAPPLQVGDHVVHASGPNGGDLLVLAVWLAVGTMVAVRRFRWEPRGR